jgi:DNA-binding MarR family transcriptional regulator
MDERITRPEQRNFRRGQRPGSTLQLLDGLTGYRLRRAQQAAYQAFDEACSRWNITPAQFGLLCKIADNPGISQTALARWVGLQRSTLGEIVNRLARRKLISRHRDPKDRRSYALSLTPEGEAFLEELIPVIVRQDEVFVRKLSRDEIVTLNTMLRRLGS